MASEFLGNMPRRRRMPRQIGKHCTALIEATVGVILAEHHLIAGLMQTSHEDEFAAMNRLTGLQPSPTGEDFGEIDDIGLAIASANAERVHSSVSRARF